MDKEKYIKPIIDITFISCDIISTSGPGSYVDPGTEGGGEIPEVDPWAS